MFQKLQQKWKVNGTQLFLILCVFAITGTTTAWITRQITSWLEVTPYSWEYWLLKLGMLVLGYQVLILMVSIPFGQFSFFWKYEKKILARMKLIRNEKAANAFLAVNSDLPTMNTMTQERKESSAKASQSSISTINIAIFASGAGSNAQKIIDHLREHPTIKVALIACNKPEAGVLDIAQRENIPYIIIEKEKFFRGNAYVDELRSFDIHLVVLAGFLWKVPSKLVEAYAGSIINIHPALLPAYGGKGMYGSFVHRAVIEAGEKESGITIHFVDEQYDHGTIILQERCTIEPEDTPESLATKIHQLEHTHYPLVIEKLGMELQNRR